MFGLKRHGFLWLISFALLAGVVSLVLGWSSWQKYKSSTDPARAMSMVGDADRPLFVDDLSLDSLKQALDRNLEFLAGREVATMIHYPVPPHLQEAYSDRRSSWMSYPLTEQLAKEVLSLPMGPHLGLDQAEYVCDSVLEFFHGRKGR